jgi:probable HAF family extracellular repeat protein
LGINDSGDIVGDYFDASGVQHAYLLSQGTFTTIDPPGSIQTRGIGINNRGVIGGTFLDSNKVRHSYLLDQGNFTIFDFPGATATFLQGMDNQQVVGAYSDARGLHGFLRSGGNFTAIDFPGAVGQTVASDINEPGQIVGNYEDASGKLHGFLLSDGNFTTFDFPGAFSQTVPSGIAANGNIVGAYNDDSGLAHGFQLQQGSFSTIDFPGARQTQAVRVNEAGQVVGFYNLAGLHGFLATPMPSAQNTPSLYDDFSEGFIDPSKWSVLPMCGFTGYDCAREVQHGHLRLAVRGYGDPNSDSGTSVATSPVIFRNPNSINSIQLNLNVESFTSSACPANSDAAHPQFLVSGTFFNTGTADASGDVSAFFMVERRTDDTFDPPGVLRVGGFMSLNGQFFNNVDLGTLQVGEGAQGTLRLDRLNHAVVVRIVKSSTTPSIVEQSMPYSVPDSFPPFASFKMIQVNSFAPNCTAQRSVAAMDVNVDNVRVGP